MGSEEIKTPADSRSEAEKSILPQSLEVSEALTSPPSHGTSNVLISLPPKIASGTLPVSDGEKQGTSGERISNLIEEITNINISKIKTSSEKQITAKSEKDAVDSKDHEGDSKIVQPQALKQLSSENNFISPQNPPRIENENDESFLTSDSTRNFTENSSSAAFTLLLRKDSHQFCRICHEVGSDDSFISPCRCKGSLSLVHKWCLERWLAESDTNHCELCGFVFNVSRKPKYNIIWSLLLWLWTAAPRRERRLLLCDTLLFAALCPLIILTTVLAFQVAESILGPDINEKIIQLGLQLSRENIQFTVDCYFGDPSNSDDISELSDYG
ncbi:uncharacterized protein isoform X2 [Rhodnius prolixus]|uniref:uncharacterized protein isoform X2 n=1 Tax=Rhodnius prolixus TaxID=13249 RepID=UPI003D18A5EC